MTTSHEFQPLDSYSMMITSKYFNSENDFINMICVNSKFKDTLDKFHFNPIPVTNTKLFPKMQTQYHYSPDSIFLHDIENHLYWYPVSYQTQQSMKNSNYKIIFKNVVYRQNSDSFIKETIPDVCNIIWSEQYATGNIITQTISIPTQVTLLDDSYISNVTKLGTSCFDNCKSLSSITITKHLEDMGNTFINCITLQSILVKEHINTFIYEVPYSISLLLKQQHINCSNIYYRKDDVERYGKEIPIICNKLFFKFNITSIGYACFSSCSNLTSIQLPVTLKSLPSHCFDSCSKLKSIDCFHITYLGYYCFSECNTLTSIKLSSNLKKVEPYCFGYKLTSLSFIRNLNSIPPLTLNRLWSKKFVISSQFTSIGNSCFSNSRCLKEISMSTSVKLLGHNCFSFCSSLTSITLSCNVESLPNSCFNYCTMLSFIELPDSITRIGNGCFQQCYRLSLIYLPKNLIQLGKSCFQTCTSLKQLIIPSVQVIDNCCFSDCISLSTIYLPTSLSSIGKKCFKNCCSLKTISISSNVVRHEPIGERYLTVLLH
ncbi:Leucine rich repeat containing protein BspA family protein [Entamoeba marina]